MNVLFVCRRNNYRSPIAEALFNNLKSGDKAISAGGPETQEGRFFPNETIIALRDEGIDVSSEKTKAASRGMVKRADKIIVLCEEKYCSDFVLDSGKVEFWHIEDPEKKGKPSLNETIRALKERILNL